MPTHRARKETRQDPIRLKNLVREAEERLLALGYRTPEARSLIEPAVNLIEDGLFWRNQGDGLALFLSPNKVYRWRLPLGFTELVVVTDRFHIKPLLPLFSSDGRFYVLALSQNRVRLFQGTRHLLDEVDLAGIPTALAEALRSDVVEQHLQFHTGTAGGPGKRPAMSHGQGRGGDERRKTDILRFFQKLDRGLHELLRDERCPLVLAGVEYLQPLFREASSYLHLVEEGIIGNPEELRPEELSTRAWAVVEPLFRRAQGEAVARFNEFLGTGLASANLVEVVPAARQGRVETLFVAVGVQSWGWIDSNTAKVEVHEQHQPGDVDLLDFAAVHSLTNRGVVYAVERGQVPGNGDLATIFRY
jgi:hypothetical protein